MSRPSPHVDPEALTPEEVAQVNRYPVTTAKVGVGDFLGWAFMVFIWLLILMPVCAFLLRVSLSATSHLWGWAIF